MLQAVERTVNIISSDPPCKDGNARFTTVPLKGISNILPSTHSPSTHSPSTHSPSKHFV